MSTDPPIPATLPTADEAEAAILFLRRNQWWPRRGFLPSEKPWRNANPWFLMLNGPVSGVEARWFSWAHVTTMYLFGVLATWPERLALAAQNLRAPLSPPDRLPAAWDWTRNPKGTTGAPLDVVSEEPTRWPIWADELTAQRRLLQAAALHLADANPTWSDNKAHPVTLPTTPEWHAISALCARLSNGIELSLRDANQQVWVKPSQSAVYHLWLVVNGFAHLRSCVACGRWVIAFHRPRRTCDTACRIASHRKQTVAS